MSDWKLLPLSELTDIVTGSTPAASQTDSWGDQVDFITPSDQTENQREAIPARRLSSEGARRLAKRVVPARSTNLTCIGATIGKVSMTQSAAVTNQQINSLVARGGVSDPDFVFYMIKNWSGFLKDHASGSATPIVNKSVLSKFEFFVPPLDEQHSIAQVLGALDDKIAANTKLISTTDELSHTLFRSMAGSGGHLIPLSDTAKFVNGKAFTKGASGTGRVVVRIAELNSGLGTSTVYNDIEVDDQHVTRPGDLLFAWSGSLTLHRWFRPEAIVNQHIFKVIPNDDYPRWLVYELLRHKLDQFKAIAADKATTMGHIQRKHLDEPVAVPASAIIRRHNELMTALWDKGLTTEVENLKLAETRDTLLPQLMSGKLRVKDAEAVLEKAGV